jgi:hypothetical protein
MNLFGSAERGLQGPRHDLVCDEQPRGADLQADLRRLGGVPPGRPRARAFPRARRRRSRAALRASLTRDIGFDDVCRTAELFAAEVMPAFADAETLR